MSTATSTTTQAAPPAGLPSRTAVRWYQLAVIVLGVALAAVTALAVYLAVNNSTSTVIPASNSASVQSGTYKTYNGHPCWQIHLPC